MERYGPLSIDGERLPDLTLRRLVNDAVAAVRPAVRLEMALGAGTVDALTILVSALTARVMETPVVLGPPPDRRSIRPRIGIYLVIVNGVVQARPVAERDGCLLPAETAAVFWTSGSSGDPRAVLHTTDGMAYQMTATVERLGITTADRLLLPLPLHHAYGHSVMLTWLATGAALHLYSGFQPNAVAKTLCTEGITTLDGVPSSYAVLLRMAMADAELRRALATLRIRACGGDVLPRALADRFVDIGTPLHDGYGLTEAGPNVALSAPGLTRSGTVGPALAGTRIRINSETREIEVHSPSVMLGYLGGGREGFTPDGWLRTGDIGELGDDGYLRIHGRDKEVVVVHGETVAPAVIEEALNSCPQVRCAGVVGVATGQARGDQIIAFVESTTKDAVAGQIQDFCASLLAPQFRPDRIVLVSQLPILGSQKLDRQTLRTWARAEAATW